MRKTTAQQKEEAQHTGRLNRPANCCDMCKDCLTHCKGCTNTVYTGCIYRISVERVKLLIKAHNEALAISDELDAEWANYPGDEELEKRWDAAYKAEMKLYEDIIDVLKHIINTDTKTARKVYDTYRNRIEDLLTRCVG